MTGLSSPIVIVIGSVAGVLIDASVAAGIRNPSGMKFPPLSRTDRSLPVVMMSSPPSMSMSATK